MSYFLLTKAKAIPFLSEAFFQRYLIPVQKHLLFSQGGHLL
jgi:hypothetical protein